MSAQAKEVLTFLKLDILGLQNAVFVCCSLFNMTHSRMNLVGTLILHKLLNVEFGLPADSSFPELVDQLPTHSELLTKYAVMFDMADYLILRHVVVNRTWQRFQCLQSCQSCNVALSVWNTSIFSIVDFINIIRQIQTGVGLLKTSDYQRLALINWI